MCSHSLSICENVDICERPLETTRRENSVMVCMKYKWNNDIENVVIHRRRHLDALAPEACSNAGDGRTGAGPRSCSVCMFRLVDST